jgi:hypothetical protein
LALAFRQPLASSSIPKLPLFLVAISITTTKSYYRALNQAPEKRIPHPLRQPSREPLFPVRPYPSNPS